MQRILFLILHCIIPRLLISTQAISYEHFPLHNFLVLGVAAAGQFQVNSRNVIDVVRFRRRHVLLFHFLHGFHIIVMQKTAPRLLFFLLIILKIAFRFLFCIINFLQFLKCLRLLVVIRDHEYLEDVYERLDALDELLVFIILATKLLNLGFVHELDCTSIRLVIHSDPDAGPVHFVRPRRRKMLLQLRHECDAILNLREIELGTACLLIRRTIIPLLKEST